MYIDIHILYYLLKAEGVLLIEKEICLPFQLNCMQQMDGEKIRGKEHRLYIGSWENYMRIKDYGEAKYFAISGKIDSKVVERNRHHVLVFPDSIGTEKMREILQERWEYVLEWHDRVMLMIHNGKSLQDVFDAATEILDFPVALFDKYSILVATAGKVPDPEINTVWQEVVKNQRFPNDEIAPAQTRRIYEDMIKNKWVVQYYSKKHQEYHLTCAIILQKKFFGIIGSSSKQKFSDGQISLFWQIKMILEWILMQNVQRVDRSQEVPYYIERMLLGYETDPGTVEFQINAMNWKLHEDYRVICVKSMSNEAMYADDSMRFMPSIHEFFPIAITFYYENSIVCIVKMFGKQYYTSTAFLKFLEKNGLRAGISLEFRNFMHLEYAYIQCKQALQAGSCRIAEFEKVYHICLLKSLGEITSLKSLCHPRILQYWDTGGEKEREYIQCLKAYLKNGRSITDAAKKLKIHRNTLIYRLEYMGKLLGVDLKADYLDDDCIALLSFSCDIVEYLDNQVAQL